MAKIRNMSARYGLDIEIDIANLKNRAEMDEVDKKVEDVLTEMRLKETITQRLKDRGINEQNLEVRISDE